MVVLPAMNIKHLMFLADIVGHYDSTVNSWYFDFL